MLWRLSIANHMVSGLGYIVLLSFFHKGLETAVHPAKLTSRHLLPHGNAVEMVARRSVCIFPDM